MPTVYRYAESNSKTGFYLKGWLPDQGNTTLQVQQFADELLSWMEFSHGQKLPHEFFTALQDAGLVYTESQAEKPAGDTTSVDVRSIRTALTSRQYKRLLGFLKAKANTEQSTELTALADHFANQHIDVPDSAIPSSTPDETEVDHGRFADIVDDVFGDADVSGEDQPTCTPKEWAGMELTAIREGIDVRPCRVQTYNPATHQATVEFSDTDEVAVVTVALEADSQVEIKEETTYLAAVKATTDGRRLTQIWRYNESGPVITPVHGEIQDSQADVIVCPTGTRLVMYGGVAGALRRVGDDEIQEEAMAEAPVSVGELVVTEAPGLGAEYVLHAVTDSDTKRMVPPTSLVRDLTVDIIRFGQQVNARTLAIPLLGCGAAGLEPADGAEVIVQTLADEGAPETEYRIITNTSKAYDCICESHSKYTN